MKKVKISITNKALLFSYSNDVTNIEKLLNTNIISNDELLFSDEYITINTKIVSAFIREIILENDINRIIVETAHLANIAMLVLKNSKRMFTLTISEPVSLTYSICEKIIEAGIFSDVNCYSIPPFMIELLDSKNIKSETRFEIFFTSDFMQNNGLISYSKIYYKMNLRFDFPLSNEDLEDFKTFCKLNGYLKTIHFSKYDEDEIKKIVDILHAERLKNVKLLVHDNINNAKTANDIKAYNKHIKKKYKLVLRVVYSNDYLKENIGTELILSTLKMCGLVIFMIVGVVVACVGVASYNASAKVDNIKTNIINAIEAYEEDATQQTILSNKFNALIEMNNDTVAWIKVNNTKIDYPVVKTTDNEYYLKRSFEKTPSYDGWIFMDYRNKVDETPDKNTILYGHNHFYSGTMFGTLSNATKKSWLDELNNQIITFDTLYSNAKWQVFSIYKIKKTSDYLQVDFDTDSQFVDFANMLKNRSMHNFMVDIKPDDHILTLSTCVDDDSRLVVHAVLLK